MNNQLLLQSGSKKIQKKFFTTKTARYNQILLEKGKNWINKIYYTPKLKKLWLMLNISKNNIDKLNTYFFSGNQSKKKMIWKLN